MPAEVFISYCRTEELHARRLHALLKQDGVDAWYDAEIGVGQNWRQATAGALEEARIFVLLFSKAAAESEEVAKELAVATYARKLIVPVRLENVEPSGAFLYELAGRNWIDAYEDTDARLAVLASSLVEAVRRGASGESGVQFDRSAGAQGRVRLKSWHVAAALAVAGVAAMSAWLMRDGGALPVRVQRTAFFGFDSAGEDPAVRSIAAAATTEIFETMNSLRLDTIAPSQTLGIAVPQRLARAKELGALYALSGEASSSAGRVVLSVRLEDALTNVTLWSESVDGSVEEAVSLPVQAAALATDVLRCATGIRATVPGAEGEVMARLPALCRAMRATPPDVVEIFRAARDLAPGSAALQAIFAQGIFLTASRYPEPARRALLSEGETALAEGMRIDRDDSNVLLARYTLASRSGASFAELERIGLEVLKVQPQDATLNAYYASLLTNVGRHRESMSHVAVAVANDPLSGPKTLARAVGLAMSGQRSESEAAFRRVSLRMPSPAVWPAWVQAAIFADVSDPTAVFAAAPTTVDADTVACWRAIQRAYGGDAEIRRAAYEPIKECWTAGRLSLNSALLALAAIGDLDGAFALAMQLDSANLGVLYWPVARELRADPRFSTLAEQSGLVAYWRETGSRPDFCAEEAAPVCALIEAK